MQNKSKIIYKTIKAKDVGMEGQKLISDSSLIIHNKYVYSDVPLIGTSNVYRTCKLIEFFFLLLLKLNTINLKLLKCDFVLLIQSPKALVNSFSSVVM